MRGLLCTVSLSGGLLLAAASAQAQSDRYGPDQAPDAGAVTVANVDGHYLSWPGKDQPMSDAPAAAPTPAPEPAPPPLTLAPPPQTIAPQPTADRQPVLTPHEVFTPQHAAPRRAAIQPVGTQQHPVTQHAAQHEVAEHVVRHRRVGPPHAVATQQHLAVPQQQATTQQQAAVAPPAHQPRHARSTPEAPPTLAVQPPPQTPAQPAAAPQATAAQASAEGAPMQTAESAGHSRLPPHIYSVARDYGLQPDPIPLSQDFFASDGSTSAQSSPDLAAPPPPLPPRPVPGPQTVGNPSNINTPSNRARAIAEDTPDPDTADPTN